MLNFIRESGSLSPAIFSSFIQFSIGQTNPTKTTKHKQILNTITISVKAKENGRERMSAQLQSKWSSNGLEIENRTVQIEALDVANKRK